MPGNNLNSNLFLKYLDILSTILHLLPCDVSLKIFDQHQLTEKSSEVFLSTTDPLLLLMAFQDESNYLLVNLGKLTMN